MIYLLGVSRKLRPLEFIFKTEIYIVKSSQFLSPNVLWSYNVCSLATAREKRDIYSLRVICTAPQMIPDRFVVINTPKAQETNKKTSVNTNSNSFRDMLMTF